MFSSFWDENRLDDRQLRNLKSFLVTTRRFNEFVAMFSTLLVENLLCDWSVCKLLQLRNEILKFTLKPVVGELIEYKVYLMQ